MVELWNWPNHFFCFGSKGREQQFPGIGICWMNRIGICILITPNIPPQNEHNPCSFSKGWSLGSITKLEVALTVPPEKKTEDEYHLPESKLSGVASFQIWEIPCLRWAAMHNYPGICCTYTYMDCGKEMLGIHVNQITIHAWCLHCRCWNAFAHRVPFYLWISWYGAAQFSRCLIYQALGYPFFIDVARHR